VVYLNRREPERALRQLEAAELLAAEQRLSLIFETGMLRGAALAEQGAVDEAIARIREGVTKWTRLGRTFLLPYGLAFLAQGLVRHGDQAAALAALREGLALADVTGEHFWDAELHRLTGTCCSPKTSSTRAEPPFSTQSTLRKPNKRNRWNCAPPPASRASGAIRAGGTKHAISLLRSTAGSPKGSTRAI
jgi:Predicted ATPase